MNKLPSAEDGHGRAAPYKSNHPIPQSQYVFMHLAFCNGCRLEKAYGTFFLQRVQWTQTHGDADSMLILSSPIDVGEIQFSG